MALIEISAMSNKGLLNPSLNLTVRITPEFRHWLERAALHRQTTPSAFFDSAALAHARKHGFDEPAPKR